MNFYVTKNLTLTAADSRSNSGVSVVSINKEVKYIMLSSPYVRYATSANFSCSTEGIMMR